MWKKKLTSLIKCNTDTIVNHFGQTNTHIIFSISSSIVEKIIGDMFFHPDDYDSTTCAHVLKLFIPNEAGSYTVTINNPLQFHLVVDYFTTGLSFQQVMNVFNKTKKCTGMAELGNMKDTTVANYA